MSHNANLGSTKHTGKTLIAPGHAVVIRTAKLKGAQGVLDKGQVLAKDAAGDLVPYTDEAVSLGTGNGVLTDFGGALTIGPVAPLSFAITDGTQTVTDDGHGNLYGDGTGTINYVTGAASVSFAAPSANAADILASGWNVPSGVLERKVDTAGADDGQVVIHGSVVGASLLAKGVAATPAILERLERAGVYAR